MVFLLGLERNLNNERGTADWPKNLILKDRDRLNYLRAVCGLWTTMQDTCRGQPAIKDDLTLDWVMDGNGQGLVPPGLDIGPRDDPIQLHEHFVMVHAAGTACEPETGELSKMT